MLDRMRRFRTIALVAVVSLGAPSTATADEVELLDALRKAFRAEEFEPRRQAIEGLASQSSLEAARALVDAFERLEREAAPIEKERRDLIDREGGAGPVPRLRREIDPIRVLQSRILAIVERYQSPDVAHWLVEEIALDGKQALTLRLTAARRSKVLGSDALALLEKPMLRGKKPNDLAVTLEALTVLGPLALPLADAAVDEVDHKDPAVRERAALALARMGAPQAIEPLVARLPLEHGRTLQRLVAALQILTAQPHGASHDAWSWWLEKEGGPYVRGEVPLGQGTPEAEVTSAHDAEYFGIAQDGESIVYIIDLSSSMHLSIHSTQRRLGRRIPKLEPGEQSRMQVAREELAKALGALSPTKRFNIVYYADTAKRYSPRILEASPKAIEKAQEWVRALEPGGMTNIYDAVESAFALAGRGTTDRFFEAEVDTIFLLTDGQAYLPGSRREDPPERILEAVRRWNSLQRVVIHAIGLSPGADTDLLQQLANENGGQYASK